MTSEADIIIVGGGTAGLVLASRLSENPDLQVLVLEAGQDQGQDPRVNTPALWSALVATDSSWNFMTEPQGALNGKQIPIPQGRLLGGTSAMNGLAWIANSKSNVNAWGALGNPGWDWETVNPYYKKTYTLTLPSDEKCEELSLGYVDPQIHTANGPLKVSFPDALIDPVANAWIESLRGMGYAMKHDPFSGQVCGSYINGATIDPIIKTRSYSLNAYYLPAKDRANLHVITGAQVHKVVLEPTTSGELAATGVQYALNGELITAKARLEVIVAAGVYNSPKLLELSGIGSSEILKKFDIPVLVDNPNVGENLQDHPLAGVSFEAQDFLNTKDDMMRGVPEAIGAAMAEYQEKQFGAFTVGGNYSSALLPLADFADSENGARELASVLSSMAPSASEDFEAELTNYVQSVLENKNEATGGYFTYPAQADFRGSGADSSRIDAKLPGNYISICVSILHPLSRGNSHITSAKAEDPPAIDPRYLSHPADLEMLARHTRFVDSIAASEPFASMLKPGGKRSPGAPADLRAVSLDEVKEYVQAAGKSTFHPTSTCSMMPREKGGVVDARLRVWGTRSLRVVDASVIPIIPTGNTQSAVYAIAERAADLIKEDLSKA
ncbi:glucose-methanol-choline oxidoreductase-like protein [Penicillium malachiteum]|uniref:Glucose-methanol-choline oxidoreductase-like protein n=1 Tax=Penicillium malachiteum TaxID=1324776 RepID=A0AAD6HPQ3_9EURO|nr:glucose-methanol-choline oxidoreductase-like protein [Penicillium malachiteum]